MKKGLMGVMWPDANPELTGAGGTSGVSDRGNANRIADVTDAELAARPEEETLTRERLLQQGMRLVLAHGYATVSTRQICAAAGVTQPSLYHHFGSKDGLYVAVIQRWFETVHAALNREIARDTSFPGRLHRVAVIFWSGEVGDYQAMQRDALRHLPPERALSLTATIFHAVVAPILGVMRDAMANGELPPDTNPGALMHMYWALVDGLAGEYHRGDPLPAPTDNIAPIALFVAGAHAMDPTLLASWPATPSTWPRHVSLENQEGGAGGA